MAAELRWLAGKSYHYMGDLKSGRIFYLLDLGDSLCFENEIRTLSDSNPEHKHYCLATA